MALRIADIPPDRRAALNSGAEASNLTECLAVDFAALMRAAFPALAPHAARMEAEAKAGITRRMALAAELADEAGLAPDALARHGSDTVRGWACFLLTRPEMTISERLAALRPLADDAHFGVREWAWLALRPHTIADLSGTLDALVPWTADPSPNLRRFASEATRPRGVWCAHIKALKADPAPALPILEPLRADPAPYVQDSVANWLNDASKDNPGWVRTTCARWQAESPAPETARIARRALRTIGAG